ncbi:MAG: phosphatidylinositol mannoside acyltransferase [Nocardioidaceae bacterium]
MGDQLLDFAFRAGWAVTRRVPESVGQRLMEGAADGVWARRGAGVVRLEANLRRAAPGSDDRQLRALSRRALRSYFRYWHEVFRLPSWSRTRIAAMGVTVNIEPLRAAFETGSGVVVALPHMANWDLAGAWSCVNGMPVSTVAQRLRPDALFERFVGYRQRLGLEVVPLVAGSGPLTAMRRSLERGRLVCLLADRDITGGGLEVDLLGEPARLPGGPAMLARMTDAPLIALTLSYAGPLLRFDFSQPIQNRPGRSGLAAMTQDVADHFSAGILAHPADWHMLQDVFRAEVMNGGDSLSARGLPGPRLRSTVSVSIAPVAADARDAASLHTETGQPR